MVANIRKLVRRLEDAALQHPLIRLPDIVEQHVRDVERYIGKEGHSRPRDHISR